MGAGGSGRRGVPEPERAELLLAGNDAACAEAARLISDADIFLLCTGAGFSADSGLAVYADVAKVDAYAARGLTYSDICQPSWMSTEPELFWGFWGQCHNDYRETAPHTGYEIIDAWAERRFRHSEMATLIRQQLAPDPEDGENSSDPYIVSDRAGAFFVFTSNVDAHHFDWFRACEIRECHGNTELYQCAQDCAESGVWRAPADFFFEVDKATMLAPAGAASDAAAAPEAAPVAGADSAPPRIGHVRGGGRPHTLRYMPGAAPAAEAAGFTSNHPSCPKCGGTARPAILMFGDYAWEDVDSQEQRYQSWARQIKLSARESRESADKPLRVVVLELGAGGNVPTVRREAQTQLMELHHLGADVRLVRVNPEMPLGDFEELRPGGKNDDLMLSIMSRGLEALHKMDAAMPGRCRVASDAGAAP